MPHIIIEHSANLEEKNVNEMPIKAHQSALETGIFPKGGLRTRCEQREKYIIADNRPDNAYCHIKHR